MLVICGRLVIADLDGLSDNAQYIYQELPKPGHDGGVLQSMSGLRGGVTHIFRVFERVLKSDALRVERHVEVKRWNSWVTNPPRTTIRVSQVSRISIAHIDKESASMSKLFDNGAQHMICWYYIIMVRV